jgi:hypothetical protein
VIQLEVLVNCEHSDRLKTLKLQCVELGVADLSPDAVKAFKDYYLEPWARDEISEEDIKACVEFDVARYRNAGPAQYHLAQQYWYRNGEWRALVGMEPFTTNKAPVRAVTVRALNIVHALYELSDREHPLYFLMTTTGEVDVCDLWKPHIKQILGFGTVAGLLEIARYTRTSMAVHTALVEGHDLRGDVLFGHTFGTARVNYPDTFLEDL